MKSLAQFLKTRRNATNGKHPVRYCVSRLLLFCRPPHVEPVAGSNTIGTTSAGITAVRIGPTVDLQAPLRPLTHSLQEVGIDQKPGANRYALSAVLLEALRCRIKAPRLHTAPNLERRRDSSAPGVPMRGFHCPRVIDAKASARLGVTLTQQAIPRHELSAALTFAKRASMCLWMTALRHVFYRWGVSDDFRPSESLPDEGGSIWHSVGCSMLCKWRALGCYLTFAAILLGSTLSVKAACIPPPNTYDAEAYLWSTQVATNSGTLSGAAYRAGTTYMQQIKWWGVRPYKGRVNLYVGTDTNAMVCPIIRDWWDGIADTVDALGGFVAADYSESSGLTGNTTTKYLLPNGKGGSHLALQAHTTAANVHFGAYVRTASTESSFVLGSQQNFSTPITYLAVSSASSSEGATSAVGMGASDANGVGFYVLARRSTTDASIYKNGSALVNSTTSETGALSTWPMMVHALNQSGTAVLNTSRTLCHYSFGTAIPAALSKADYDAVQNVQLTMGRAK